MYCVVFVWQLVVSIIVPPLAGIILKYRERDYADEEQPTNTRKV